MEDAYRHILEAVGEDPTREGLLDTPSRAAKAMQFLTRGYSQSLDEVVNNALFESDSEEMVVVQNIELYSMCEHHMLPFFGKCHVAYIPDGQVVGLSKIPRIVEVFTRRLQVQERLTVEISEFLNNALKPSGVAVVINGYHLCMAMRGVKKAEANMVTSSMFGTFRKDERTRAEFLSLIDK